MHLIVAPGHDLIADQHSGDDGRAVVVALGQFERAANGMAERAQFGAGRFRVVGVFHEMTSDCDHLAANVGRGRGFPRQPVPQR